MPPCLRVRTEVKELDSVQESLRAGVEQARQYVDSMQSMLRDLYGNASLPASEGSAFSVVARQEEVQVAHRREPTVVSRGRTATEG